MVKKAWTAIVIMCASSIVVNGAHLEYVQGIPQGVSSSCAFNATESDPFDDPGTSERERELVTGSDAVTFELETHSSVSTAQADGSVMFQRITTAEHEQLMGVFSGSVGHEDAASGAAAQFEFWTRNMTDGTYGISYRVAADREPAGTEVILRLYWFAQTAVSGDGGGSGYVTYQCGDAPCSVGVAINQDPMTFPEMESMAYRGQYQWFTGFEEQGETVTFLVKVGDLVTIYWGGIAAVFTEEQAGSASICGQMRIFLDVLEGPSTLPADINGDKRVNLADVAILAENWLWEGHIYNVSCQTALGVEDGKTYAESTVSTPAGELWYLLRPSVGARYHISLCGSDFDTRLTAYDAVPGSCTAYVQGENDDACGKQSALTVDCYDYPGVYLRVDSPTQEHGMMRMHVTRIPPPQNDTGPEGPEVFSDTIYNGSTIGSVGDMSVWYTFIPAESGSYTFSLCGSDYDTILQVYEYDDVLAANDDFCGAASELTVGLTAEHWYYVEVGGHERGEYELVIRPSAIP